MERCKFKQGKFNCGSYAFNLYKENIDQGDYCDHHYWQDQAMKAITALREALSEQPAQQKPVAAECKFDREEKWVRCEIAHHNLVQSEPHKWPGYQTRLLYTHPQAREPEQPPQQEPVATLWQHSETGRTRITQPGDIMDCDARWFKAADLYTAPPTQRPWVGLTLERKMDMAESYFTDEWAINRAIQLLSGCENALKEKNT